MPHLQRIPYWLVVLLVCALAAVPTACSSADDEADRPAPVEAAPATTTDDAPQSTEQLAEARRRVAERIAALMDDSRVKGTTLGVSIRDTADDAILFASRADEPMIPASNMKLVTTAAAWSRLGPRWRLRTLIGTLGDDLVVVGGGDPNLSGRFYGGDPVAAFRQWALLLRQRGITEIAGDLVFDDSLFDAQWRHPNWLAADLAKWYAAPIGALILNDSCLDVTVSSKGLATGDAKVIISPATGYVATSGRITVRPGSKGPWYADLQADVRLLAVGGSVPPGISTKTYSKPVDDPGLFAATVLRETLVAEGIAVAGKVVRRRVWTDDWRMPEGFVCHVVQTSSLAQTVRVANTRSQNLYGECLMKTLAAFAPERAAVEPDDPGRMCRPVAQGSWPGGAAAMASAMTDLGLSVEGCVFDDGSGLSAENRVTADLLCGLLVAMARHDDAEQWIDTLAAYRRAGGSLRNWPLAPTLQGRVRAKSGTLPDDHVCTLSGYVPTRSGRRLAFSFLANGIPGKLYDAMEWMATVLIDLERM